MIEHHLVFVQEMGFVPLGHVFHKERVHHPPKVELLQDCKHRGIRPSRMNMIVQIALDLIPRLRRKSWRHACGVDPTLDSVHFGNRMRQ